MLSNSTIAALKRSILLGLSFVFVGSSVTSQQLDDRTSSKTPSTYQATDDWARYTVRDRDFSVLLPTSPAMSSYEKSKNPFNRIVHLNVIGAYSQGVVYEIQIFERKQSLEKFIEEYARSSKSEFKREVKVDGVRGKEYGFQFDTRKGVTQYFITSRYIYVFSAQGSYLGNPDVGLPKFFESIRFQPTQVAEAIVESSGEQSTLAPKLNTHDDTRILPGREVTQKAVVVIKPEPKYTEDARRNSVTGTVVLRAVFSSSGAMTRIRLVSGLPDGLSEKAIVAARQIRFIPAIKEGRFVSMHVQLEYSFNLY